MTKENTVQCAGGFIVQLMPFASDEIIEKLEENLKGISSVTSMLSGGDTPEEMLGKVLAGMDIEFTGTMPTEYHCDCSRDRLEKVLISLGRNELQSMIDEGHEVEVGCQFCNTQYTFQVDELKSLLRQSSRD